MTKLQKDLPITLGLTIINTIGRNNVEKLQISARLSGDYYSPTIEENLPAVVFRTHREVNPIGGAALLLNELIKHPAVFVGGVEQQTGAANHREIYFLSTSRSKKSRKKGQLGPASWPPWC